jgi:methionyl-tRNA formyltransferase
MELKVYTKNDPILRQPTEEVTDFDMELQNLIDNMVETMRNNSGIGISAPQVGVSKRIIAGEFEGDKKEKHAAFPLTIICNPKIKHLSRNECKIVEGCLSFPGLELIVKRPKKITVSGFDRYGKPIEIEDDRLLARVIQHEIDHLNSTLLIDHLEKISVIYFGTGPFGTKSLELLSSDPQYKIDAVITSEGREIIKRGQQVEQNLIKKLAKKLKLPIITIKTLKDDKVIQTIKKLKPELGVVSDFGFIIPKEVINIPKYGILNVHPSLLPEFRGPTPIQSAILSGAKNTGVTIILINEKVDAGQIISRARVKLKQTENYQILSQHLSEIGAALLLNSIPYYITHELKPKNQNNNKATYTKMINKDDGEVGSSTPEIEVERKIRAFSEWPKVFTIVKGKRIQLTAAHFDREYNLVIDRVKPESKNEMNYEDFCRGYHTRLTFSK